MTFHSGVCAPPTITRPRLYDILPGVLTTAREMAARRSSRARVTVNQNGSPVLQVVVPMATVKR